MERRLAPISHELDANRLLSLCNSEDWTVTCEQGHVWLTLEGHSQDKLLVAGERVRLPAGGHAVLQGHGAARVRLEPTAIGIVQRFLGIARHRIRHVGRVLANTAILGPGARGCHASH